MQNKKSNEHQYLNDFHKKNSEACQEAVKRAAMQSFTVEEFIAQAKKVNSPNRIKRIR